MNRSILIWAELTREKYLHPVVFELAAKACELSQKLPSSSVEILLFIPDELSEDFKEAFRNNGIDKVYYVTDKNFSEYRSDLYSYAAVKAVKELSPEIMLVGATNQGRDLAPRISSALNTGLTADCTSLDILDNEKLAATRPTFGGQLMATILSKTYPQMATIRPKVFKSLNESMRKDTIFTPLHFDVSEYVSNIEILDFEKKLSSDLNNLDSAEIVVAGGKGMQNREGFELLKQLADKLGGSVAASRTAVEMGLASAEIQVGQTGKTISPKLYIACGISGALQHTIGMENSEKIIAINSDKNAPIFKISDYGFVGDVFDILPKLIKKIK